MTQQPLHTDDWTPSGWQLAALDSDVGRGALGLQAAAQCEPNIIGEVKNLVIPRWEQLTSSQWGLHDGILNDNRP
eukprot:3207625-Rhodomonas_salina.1